MCFSANHYVMIVVFNVHGKVLSFATDATDVYYNSFLGMVS